MVGVPNPDIGGELLAEESTNYLHKILHLL
jgi:hypothetical protein